MIIGQTRGSFPKGPDGETPAQKRERYELWIIQTHEAVPPPGSKRHPHIDPEYEAIRSQPNHRIVKIAAPRTSETLCIQARCWQCQGGDTDDGGIRRIANCASVDCLLWSVRPHQDADAKVPRRFMREIDKSGIPKFDLVAKVQANPGNRSMAVLGYCHQCKGGAADMKTRWAVRDCTESTCALWVIRYGA